MKRPPGLYDLLLTRGLERELADLPSGLAALQEGVDASDLHERLARHFAGELATALRALRGKDEGAAQQIDVVNRLLEELASRLDHDLEAAGNEVVAPAKALLAIHSPPAPPERPTAPLATSTLLTQARHEPRLGSELTKEIASADAVDMLVSFVKWRGWRRVRDAFEVFARANKRLRLLTTTYMGATDKEALDAIARLPGAEVRVSFDTRRTRLHAKAWLFHRESGFSSVYVGSANLSATALGEGVEWSLKASQADAPHIVGKFRGAFDSLWEDGEFEHYDPDDAQQAARLASALSSEGGGRRIDAPFFDIRPYEYQEAILERLRVEREMHDRTRNLVVAATGTGKTMVAAFDYRAQVPASGVRPRLLFVAHREEILEQALQSFRHVLRDHGFGELLTGRSSPVSLEHVFATIQSISRRDLVASMGPSYWDYVVVDEFHRAAATTYRDLLSTVRPKLLLGLTATPERTDGLDILHWFGGHVAAEIRLWDAMEKQILVPFEYYGVADGVDLTQVRWSRGGYDLSELSNLYTGNDERARLVVEKLRVMHGRPEQAKGLGFCVSVEHARFMARRFSEAGVPSVSLDGETDEVLRTEAPRKLARGDVAFIFTCDLYNEGIDLPMVDTLLFLRPTESATLFLQQLGRGLRLHPGKESTLVLDFIGQPHEHFRFDQKLSAVTGLSRGELRKAVEGDFPTLPSGCHLHLERTARQVILENLKRTIRGGATRLTQELKGIARESGVEVTLAQFLEASGRTLEDVYSKSVGGWTTLKRLAGLLEGEGGKQERKLSVALGKLAHVDEPARLQLYGELARKARLDLAGMAEADRRRVFMLGARLVDEPAVSIGQLLKPVWERPELRQELRELCAVLRERVAVVGAATSVPREWPLATHRTYTRDEILVAVGASTIKKRKYFREGVLRLWDAKAEVFFVTLDKSEGNFSPTTAYEDYAISATRFHWQSQSKTSETSKSGRRYVSGHRDGWRFLLFVRATTADAFTFLGPVRYVFHRGSRPMSITWELAIPIPPAFLTEYATLRSA